MMMIPIPRLMNQMLRTLNRERTLLMIYVMKNHQPTAPTSIERYPTT